MNLTRLLVARHPAIGVQLGRAGTADLADGEVSKNPIGVNVLTAGFDIRRLESRGVYHGNDRDIEAIDVPLPDPALPPYASR